MEVTRDSFLKRIPKKGIAIVTENNEKIIDSKLNETFKTAFLQ